LQKFSWSVVVCIRGHRQNEIIIDNCCE